MALAGNSWARCGLLGYQQRRAVFDHDAPTPARLVVVHLGRMAATAWCSAASRRMSALLSGVPDLPLRRRVGSRHGHLRLDAHSHFRAVTGFNCDSRRAEHKASERSARAAEVSAASAGESLKLATAQLESSASAQAESLRSGARTA